ncbi:hypothetical protein COT64_02455 [Candidatus Shapirobacteria bacterium CG09_land_8_20_14_0_10_39_12]|uniref:AMMECR1 domain-containing protein n=1 Tax=Candidatus Shapirobacteria bacterium CG09_land_8_20_14_0_10_39_12 TaxID=1974885 RepID=A0A2H0WRE0_9BACT|nr:MAG: hypothetical protein COT64_02455 [Candidatus Shapirobacteria bacterium CG09_land_8_20_14_0_10_39_12]
MKCKGALLFLLLVLTSFIPLYIIVARKKTEMPDNQKQAKIIRNPYFAGSFYPQNPNELNQKIDGFLNLSLLLKKEEDLKILFVPHAGIDYSGRTAAEGFKQIAGKNYSKVIILGASHTKAFSNAAVFSSGIWKTPLGETTVNDQLVKKLIDGRNIIADNGPHQNEHSLEVELIFLQKVLKNFTIVPILVSQTSEELINTLAQKIAENLGDSLLVISSDLSHYPDWETANMVDKKTIAGILSGKKEYFEQTLKNNENQNYLNLETCACGENAIRIGLKVAEILQITDFELLKYENSGGLSTFAKASADRNRVVGYASIGAYSANNENMQKEALSLARKTLENSFSQNINPLFSLSSPLFQKKLGAFVTLRKNNELRGCIGTFESDKLLSQVISEMALAAAFDDPRFPPLTKDELKEIKIEISILTSKQKIDDWKKIELGKHGVVIENGLRSGTFLPQVAVETGWNLKEFLVQLCTQKAGLPQNCYKDPSVNIYTFEAQVFEEI